MRVLLPFAIAFSTSLSAQTTFAPVGSRWTYEATMGQWPWTDTYWNHTVQVIGDTMISGHTCSVLEFPGSDFYPTTPNLWETPEVYVTTIGDSVLFSTSFDTVFHLLVAFNAAPGDSWRIPLSAEVDGSSLYDTITYSVSATDTMWYDGEPLRRIHYTTTSLGTMYLTYGDPRIIFERVGDLLYMFPWASAFIVDGMWFDQLLCYSEPGFNWPVSGINCDVWLTTSEQAAADELFTVDPTIVETGGMVLVTFPSSSMVEVVDATGRLVNSRKNASQELRFTMQEPGIYFVRANIGSRWIGTQRVLVH